MTERVFDRYNPCKAVLLGGAPEGFVRVGGYGVVFGGKDLQGETFSADTDFWLTKLTRTPPALYQHGKDAKARREPLGTALVADPDDIGLWVEAQLDLSKKYAEAIMPLLREGKLGWSSGTAGHLTERVGAKITSWPIVEMSLTPTPAEPRTLGVHEIRSFADMEPAFKSLLPQDEGDSSAVVEDAPVAEAITQPVETMETKEAEMPDDVKVAPDMGDMQAMIMAAVTKAMQDAPGFDKALRHNPEETDRPNEKSFADYLVALQRGDKQRVEKVYKAALAEGVGETGGYLVPTEFANEILQLAARRSVVRQQNPTIINMTTREWDVPALGYTSSTAGTAPQLGGVRAYWTEEAGTKTESEPTFEIVKLIYHELSGYTLASNMVRMDAGPMLESMLRNLFAQAIAFYEDYAFINGTGAGQPLGVLQSPALVTEVAATSTFVLTDAASMLEKFMPRDPNGGVWFMHPKLISKLIALVDAGSHAVWLSNSAANVPMPAQLFGKPIVFTDLMPVLPAGTSATQIGGVLLADWSYYLIGQRQGITIDFSEHYKFINNQGTWRFCSYVDGQPWLKQAVYLVDGSNTVSPFVSLSGA